MFNKRCKLKTCHRPFRHKARNKKYCSERCEAEALKIARARQKRRRAYRKDRPELMAASMSRREAREAAIATLRVRCQHCGEAKRVGGVELHHINGDPHDNRRSNWAFLCGPCHAAADAEWRNAKRYGDGIVDPRRYPAEITDDRFFHKMTLLPEDLGW